MSHELDRAFEQLVEGSPASRRAFLARAGITGLSLTGMSTFLAACGSIKGTAVEGSGSVASGLTTHKKASLDTLHISNWPLYIDKSVNKAFVKKFGVKDFKYTEDINDNEEFFGKV